MSELNQAIANSLNSANAQFSDIAKFVENQAPALFQEILMWNAFKSTSIVIAALLPIIATLYFDYKMYKEKEKMKMLLFY